MAVKLKGGGTVDAYVRKLAPHNRAIAAALCELIARAAPKAVAAIKWGYPWWSQDGYLCYIAAINDRVNFGFYRGAELSDPDALLEGTGKGMRHIKINDVKDIKKAKFTALIKEALRLNREKPKLR